jgi:hypothetical protein
LIANRTKLSESQPEFQEGMTDAARTMHGAPFPEEPFACPACGQMLAASCRVCVACKSPINPADIRRIQPAGQAIASSAPEPAIERVRFPWPTFFFFLGGVWLAAMAGVQFLGLSRSQLLVGIAQFVSSLWVIYDAHQRRIPRPLRWGLGSLLLWIVIFPWYLSRRQRPRASCPFVEAEAGPYTRILLIILAAVFLAALVLTARYGPPT